MLRGAARAQRRELERAAWLAWHVAYLSRVRRLPRLAELLPRRRASGPQGWQAIKRVAQLWTAALGGES